MRRGFTLVELSIALVIIGLLIAGVLVAGSMMQTTKVQRVIRDLWQYEIAINNFKMNYRSYPGDAAQFVPPGDGNDEFGYGAAGAVNCATAPDAALSNLEQYQVWAHLTQAGMIKGDYSPYSSSICPGGVHSSDYGDLAHAGVIWPYTELDSLAMSAFGYPRNVPVYFFKITNQNATFNLMVSVFYILPLEAKLGSVPYSNDAVGFSNAYGVGMCGDETDSPVPCIDPAARIGGFYYLLAPI